MPISEIAQKIYEIIRTSYQTEEIINLIDFGGVAEHFLGGRGDNIYVENPPRIQQTIPSFIFSFLPSNQKFEESTIMHETGLKSGFVGTIITTKKFGSKGKSDFANEFAKWIHFNYYDDTSSLLDESNQPSINRFWVQPDAISEFHNTFPTDKHVQIITIPQFLTSILESSLLAPV